MVAIHEGMTARDVCVMLAERNHQDMGPNWTIVEKIPELHLGRWGYIPMFPFLYFRSYVPFPYPHSHVSIPIFHPFPCSIPIFHPFPYPHSNVSIPPERALEDHEKVVDAISHWPRDHTNFVMFKNNPEKYHIIKRPQVCTFYQ